MTYKILNPLLVGNSLPTTGEANTTITAFDAEGIAHAITFGSDGNVASTEVMDTVADRATAVQAVSDTVTANKATYDAYVSANDSAVAVERGRIDTMLNGAGVDVDTLAELSTKIDNAKALLDTEDTELASDIADLVASRAKFTLTGSASYTQAHGLGGKDVSVEFFETDGTTNTKVTLGYTVDATNITFTAEDTSKTYIVVAQKF